MLSYALLQQQTAEQIIDIPVPLRRRGQGGLQGSHPGQGSTAQVVEQIVDIPVRRGLPGFFPRQRSSQRTVEQLVDIPVPGGGLHVPLPDPGASASSAVSRDDLDGVFRTFPPLKKVRGSLARWVRECLRTRAQDAGGP